MYRMLTLEQAQTAILAGVRRGERTEGVPLARAPGRWLAADVVSRVDYPGFDNSAMDGYAVRVADLADGSEARVAHREGSPTRSARSSGHKTERGGGLTAGGFRLPLSGEARCGDAPGVLAPGTAMRIFTGAPLPAGADTVVIQEDVKRENDTVVFPHRVEVDQNIRRRGEDFRAGETLYGRGRRLRDFDLALLAAAGIAEVTVCARPRALVVATGDELVAPGVPLKPGEIYESNRLTTLALLEALGAEAVDGGTAPDDPAALRALLRDAADYDFIVTSGGVSVGDHDVVKQVFVEIGKIDFWKARVKPGKPIAFGHVGNRAHFFALPGNPVSSLVTFKLFVEPALIAWHGGTPAATYLSATTTTDFHRRSGRTEFLRARLYSEDGRLCAQPLKGQGSHMVGPLRDTNGLIRVEADSAGFACGETVRVMPLDGF
ncbi:MAG: molybdopterin molybdenumtransferase MoeA [Gammaproteobacteria bacterium]|nr:MAG: molybdopterin molybdenumtransferase MoeA [Gammaproteobacteria bacterium]